MQSPNLSTLDGTPINPLAEKFCSLHEERIDTLANLLWPVVELNKPLGIALLEGGDKRTQSDEECQTLGFVINPLNDELHIIGVDRLEERTAEEIEKFAATLLELARRVRTELAAM